MKIRADFVSNSSSSSFMLVGHAFDDEELKSIWLKIYPEDESKFDEMSENYDDELDYDIAYSFAEKLGLECCKGIYDYADMHVIGLPFEKMDDNETKKQFIERIEKSFPPEFGKVEVEAIVDGGYDG